jgi:hypothetical protein
MARDLLRRPMMRLIALSALLVVGTLAPAVARAHTKLYQPTPVNDSDANKTTAAPCGTIPAAPVVTQFTAGGDLQVSWYETVNHVGWFEVRFAQNGPADCTLTNTGSTADPSSTTTQDPIHRVCPTSLVAPIKDPNDSGIIESNPATWKKYVQTVKMPNVSCTGCIVQLIQWMGTYDTQGNPITYTPYYSCARVTTGTPTQPADMAGMPAPADMATGGGGGGGGGGESDMASGGGGGGGLPGCSMGGAAAAASGALPLVGLLLVTASGRLSRRSRRD